MLKKKGGEEEMAKAKKAMGNSKAKGMIKVMCSKSGAPVWANAAGKSDGHRCTKCGEVGHTPAKTNK